MANIAALLDRIATDLAALSDVDRGFPVLDRDRALLAAGAALVAVRDAGLLPASARPVRVLDPAQIADGHVAEDGDR